MTPTNRPFPAPWSVEELTESFVVREARRLAATSCYSSISFTSVSRSRGNSSGGSYRALSSFPIVSCISRRKIAASLDSGPTGRFQSNRRAPDVGPLGVSRGSDGSFLRESSVC
jgi:hypothetical protein